MVISSGLDFLVRWVRMRVHHPRGCVCGGCVCVRAQRRKVAELAARVGVEPPQELEAMAPAEVDAWLARALMGGAPAL